MKYCKMLHKYSQMREVNSKHERVHIKTALSSRLLSLDRPRHVADVNSFGPRYIATNAEIIDTILVDFGCACTAGV